tara:strand:+ start:717 stop:1544 length:828 start_codon:yes stop_codon:yes gene_type:complete
MTEYEKIASWDVSLEIPERLRRKFGGMMDSYEKGDLTDILLASIWRERDDGTIPESREKRSDEIRTWDGRLAVYRDEWLERAKEMTAEGTDYCFAEVALSLTGLKDSPRIATLPPDLFVGMMSYFAGEKEDLYGRFAERRAKALAAASRKPADDLIARMTSKKLSKDSIFKWKDLLGGAGTHLLKEEAYLHAIWRAREKVWDAVPERFRDVILIPEVNPTLLDSPLEHYMVSVYITPSDRRGIIVPHPKDPSAMALPKHMRKGRFTPEVDWEAEK